jgi:hypothetical protein
MVNPKLKNYIKKLILKEADDYFQGGEENKRNLSDVTIGPNSIKNFRKKGNEFSLNDLIILNDLNSIERAILNDSLNNSKIKYKVENNVVYFSKKDAEKLINQMQKLLTPKSPSASDYNMFTHQSDDWAKTNYPSFAGKDMTYIQWRGLVEWFANSLFKKIKNQKNF